MKSTIKHISNTQKKVSVEISAETVQSAFGEATRHVRKKADIKGFRKGKVPDAILVQHYGSEILSQSLNHIINESYPKILQEHQLRPVLDPHFDLKPLEKEKSYTYEVSVEVVPLFEVKDYKGISLKKRPIEVAEEELNASLTRLQESRAQLQTAEEGAVLSKEGVAQVDIEGAIDGKTFKGGTVKDYVVELGKNRFFKEIEQSLEGMKKGESKEVKIVLPENATPEIRGREACFKVVVNNIYKKSLLPLDDEFAKDIGKESLDQLKTEIKNQITQKKERDHRRFYADETVESLLSDNPIEIPEALVKHQIEHNPQAKKEEVEKRFKAELILQFIADKENIQVVPQDLDRRLHEFSMLTGKPIKEIQEHYRDQNQLRGLISQLRFEKTLDFLVDHATLK